MQRALSKIMQLGFTEKDSNFALVGHVPIELSRPVAGWTLLTRVFFGQRLEEVQFSGRIKDEFSFCSSL